MSAVRGYAEVIADLLEWDDAQDDAEIPDQVSVHREAADLIEALSADMATMHRSVVHECCERMVAITALLPDCPMCGGTGFAEKQLPDRTYTALVGGPCPDCDHGKVTVAQMAAQLAAVQAALDQYADDVTAGVTYGAAAIDAMSAVAKAVRP